MDIKPPNLVMTLRNANKLSGAVAGEAIGVKVLIFILMFTNLVATSFCGYILYIKNHHEPRVPNHS